MHYSLLAGEHALSVYAYEEAFAHFQRVLYSKEEQPMDNETAALLVGLARARIAMDQRSYVQEVLANLSRAFDYYVESDDVPNALAVAECPLPIWTGSLAGMARLVGRALGLVPPDSHEAGRLREVVGQLPGLSFGVCSIQLFQGLADTSM